MPNKPYIKVGSRPQPAPSTSLLSALLALLALFCAIGRSRHMSRPSYLSRVENRRSTLCVLPNYTYGFCRWLGTSLSPRHKAIIEHIERTRQQATALNPPRIIVEDPDPATSGIPRLLTLYFQWLATCILPHRRATLVNTTKVLPDNDNHHSPAFNPRLPTYKAYKAYPSYSPYKSPSKISALCPLNSALSKNSALTTCSARRPDRLRGHKTKWQNAAKH